MNPAPHIHSDQTTRVLMLNVVIALAPCAIAAVWYFGWGALMLMLVASAAAVAFEALWQWLSGRKVLITDLSALVTGLLIAMNLPAGAPWWLAVVGSAFAVVIVKGLFGGLGDNFVNPALAARALLLASWPRYMTAWIAPTGWNAVVDAVSAATPLDSPASYTTAQLITGNIPGSIGEVCKIAILIGLVWLLVTKTISWRVPVVMIASMFACSWVLGKDPVAEVLSGGILFAAVFMATDYVTCPVNDIAQILYAAGAGVITVLIRSYAGYPEGATYAILLMNIAAPLLDRYIRRRVYGHGREANG